MALYMQNSDEIYSGIASGRVLTLELYTQRNQELKFSTFVYTYFW